MQTSKVSATRGELRICLLCGVAFPVRPRQWSKIYCSRRCMGRAWEARQSPPRKRWPNYVRRDSFVRRRVGLTWRYWDGS